MFGPIFVIIAFFICLILSIYFCKAGGRCTTDFGLGLIAGIFVFGIIVILLRIYLPSP